MGDHDRREDGMSEVAPRPRFARALRSFGGRENRNTSEFLGILANPSESSQMQVVWRAQLASASERAQRSMRKDVRCFAASRATQSETWGS